MNKASENTDPWGYYRESVALVSGRSVLCADSVTRRSYWILLRLHYWHNGVSSKIKDLMQAFCVWTRSSLRVRCSPTVPVLPVLRQGCDVDVHRPAKTKWFRSSPNFSFTRETREIWTQRGCTRIRVLNYHPLLQSVSAQGLVITNKYTQGLKHWTRPGYEIPQEQPECWRPQKKKEHSWQLCSARAMLRVALVPGEVFIVQEASSLFG